MSRGIKPIGPTALTADPTQKEAQVFKGSIPNQEPEVKYIVLACGKRVLVDAADYDWLRQWSWVIAGKDYVRARMGGKKVYMHRLITNAPRGMDVDHINGDTLDNRRLNLRVCTRAENLRNQRKHHPGTSRYKGVHARLSGRWVSRIFVAKKSIHLGYFQTEAEAARAYNEAALKHFGEFAHQNDIEVNS